MSIGAETIYGEKLLNDPRLPKDTITYTDPQGRYWVKAFTHNWAGDVFIVCGDTREVAICKIIEAIEYDGKEMWMVNKAKYPRG